MTRPFRDNRNALMMSQLWNWLLLLQSHTKSLTIYKKYIFFECTSMYSDSEFQNSIVFLLLVRDISLLLWINLSQNIHVSSFPRSDYCKKCTTTSNFVLQLYILYSEESKHTCFGNISDKATLLKFQLFHKIT